MQHGTSGNTSAICATTTATTNTFRHTGKLALLLALTAISFLASISAFAGTPAGTVGKDGSVTLVGGKRAKAAKPYIDAVALPGGDVIAVRESGEIAESAMGPVDTGLVVRIDGKTGQERVLVRGQLSENAEETLLDLAGVAISPDAQTVYLYARTVWPAVGALWAMNPDGTRARFLAPAGMKPSVVQSGPWKGYIFTTQQLHFAEGGVWYPPVLIEPASGRLEALCRKPSGSDQSLDAELLPYVPPSGLPLVPKVKIAD